MSAIVWFRRDLRLRDHTALCAAARDHADGIIPVFVLDDAILGDGQTGGPVVQFMLGCLAELRKQLRQLKGDLLLLHGEPAVVLKRLVSQTGAKALYFNRDYAPDAIMRDDEVSQALSPLGVQVIACKDQVIFEPDEIRAASSGLPYTVYTAYRKAWIKRLTEQGDHLTGPKVFSRPRLIFPRQVKSLENSPLPTCRQLGFDTLKSLDQVSGETAGLGMLRKFCQGAMAHYDRDRDIPSVAGTSHLSAHLRHGTISPRQALHESLKAIDKGGQPIQQPGWKWIGQLIWRDFFQQVLYHHPRVAHQPFRPGMEDIQWQSNPIGWKAWTSGQTGYPLVDAAMRQLHATGWMHNRLRMVVAMFLTKDLLIDYRRGERHFANWLIDHETAQNNGNWQWCAGTGVDAQPWFRIFNPVLQSQRFDPKGLFIRTYCPELMAVPDKYIHAPWEMPPAMQRMCRVQIGQHYPAPIVNHAIARQEALRLMGAGSRGK